MGVGGWLVGRLSGGWCGGWREGRTRDERGGQNQAVAASPLLPNKTLSEPIKARALALTAVADGHCARPTEVLGQRGRVDVLVQLRQGAALHHLLQGGTGGNRGEKEGLVSFLILEKGGAGEEQGGGRGCWSG